MQTNVTSTHLTIPLLSKLIISVTSTLSDNEYSQLNRNSKKTHEISNYFQEKGLILSLEVMTLFLFFFFFLFAQD